jgi:hypothetical protein
LAALSVLLERLGDTVELAVDPAPDWKGKRIGIDTVHESVVVASADQLEGFDSS